MLKGSLIVEGQSDCVLFKNLCKKNNFENIDILVDTAGNFGGKETKQGVFNILNIAIKNLEDLYIDRLGIIVDADYEENGGGVENTLNQIHQKIQNIGYKSSYQRFDNSGIYFENDSNLSKIGVWIMPNNKNEGMLEDWMLSICHSKEQPFLDKVIETVGNIPNPRFKDIHKSKAISNTWLSWQKRPGLGFSYLFNNDLIDTKNRKYTNWVDWMKRIFVDET